MCFCSLMIRPRKRETRSSGGCAFLIPDVIRRLIPGKQDVYIRGKVQNGGRLGNRPLSAVDARAAIAGFECRAVVKRGKHEREKIRVRCETCTGAGEVLSAAGEAIIQLIRRALSGPVAPKVSDEVLAEELRAAEKRLDLRDKERADKIAREEEARRIVSEAEERAKAIREGRV